MKLYHIIYICIALLGVMAPIIFAWIVEISWEPKQDIVLTNGFRDADPLKVYHIALYFVVATSMIMAFLVITNIIFDCQNEVKNEITGKK